MAARLLFFIILAFTLTSWASPPLALVLGLGYGLSFANPFLAQARRAQQTLLQLSVVGLGFGMKLQQVLHAGRTGFVYTAIGIMFALALGMLLGKALRVKNTPAFLISAGTAICGGSAIAAVGPIAQADDHEMAVSLGTVFILNSVALLIFPGIGLWLHLTQVQFGLWSALAIHDTSSVVGAAAKFGAEALTVATTVKLARALWIVPLCLATAAVKHARARIKWPWFILFFVLAAVANSYLPAGARVYAGAYALGKIGLTTTLFLIGSGVSLVTLKEVGAKPMIQGVLLWIIVAMTSLAMIHYGFAAI
jgi:uncharacterized integral membrane protein (TIGR00698 family)